jgi:hypothetical protein
MFCKSCDYNLTGITDRNCPECGTAFDPADPDFDPGVSLARRRKRRRVIALGWPLVAYAWLIPLTPFVSWLVEEACHPDGAGPWNHPGSVGVFLYLPWWLSMLTLAFLWLPLAVFAIGAWLVYLDSSRRAELTRTLWVVLAVLASCLLVLYYTPVGSEIRRWWFD